MDLYLVRHGIADDRDARRWPDDSQRPLTDRGKQEFARAAVGLRTLVPGVEVLLSSPFVRAWETASLLETEAGWTTARRCDELASGGTPEETARALAQYAGEASVALVGHEPDLSELASYLLTGDANMLTMDLKKGGVIGLRLEGEPCAGAATLTWLLTPKVLRALGG